MKEGTVSQSPRQTSVALIAVAVIVGVASIAGATVPDQNGLIYACYHKVSGEARIVDPAKQKCIAKWESLVSWNETGPQGPAGPQGAQGSQGLQGPRGADGPQGPQGLLGPQGLSGPQGVPGKDGKDGQTGASGQNGQDGTPGLSKAYNTSTSPVFGSEIPVGDFGDARVIDELYLPEGNYVVTAKLNIFRWGGASSGSSREAVCSLHSGPGIVDSGRISGPVPGNATESSAGVINLTSVLRLASPGQVDLRCFRVESALVSFSSAQLTAIRVNEVEMQ